jgi:hypothetical protein
MAWNIDTSRDRIARIAAAIPEIQISDLAREMTLENVRLANPKRIAGVHSYIALANEQRLVDDLLDVDDHDAAKRAARLLHLYQRAVGRTADTFGAARIHFQGSRLHALTYRPFSDHAEIVARSVAMVLAAELVVRQALNPALEDEPGLTVAAGAAYGQSLATMSGSRGDSELLFIGDPANDGAKAIDLTCRLRASTDLLDLLDCNVLGIDAAEQDDGYHALTMSQDAIEDAAKRFKIDWTLDAARKKVNDDVDAITLDSVGVSKAVTEIDKERLSLSNCKLNQALTIFGDLDGFTAIVAAAMGDDDRLADLVCAFHVIRAELRHVAVADYGPTLRVQYQGDRIQLARHLPHDDPAKRALQAIRIAASWNSSLTLTLPELLDLEGIALATGIADGTTLFSKLGTHGNRDIVAVGPGVRRAERIQRNLDGGEIGLDGATLELLPEDVQGLFEWRAGAQGHVCVDRDINDIELALRAATYDVGETQQVIATAAKVAVGVGAAAALVGVAAKAAAEHRNRNDDDHNGSGNGGGEGGGSCHHGGGGHGGGHGHGHGGNVTPGRRWAG